jgi:hypothetical protein
MKLLEFMNVEWLALFEPESIPFFHVFLKPSKTNLKNSSFIQQFLHSEIQQINGTVNHSFIQ